MKVDSRAQGVGAYLLAILVMIIIVVIILVATNGIDFIAKIQQNIASNFDSNKVSTPSNQDSGGLSSMLKEQTGNYIRINGFLYPKGAALVSGGQGVDIGLIGLWHLNGDTSSALSGGQTGTIKGAVVKGDGLWGASSMSFPGAAYNSGIEINSINLPVGSSSRTLSAWFNVRGTGGTQRGTEDILEYGPAGTNMSSLTISEDNVSNVLAVGFSGGGTECRGNIYGGRFNSWHNFVATYDNSSAKIIIYLDGQQVTSCSNTINTPQTDKLFVGSREGANNFNGLIQEVIIWNRILNANEIGALYSNSFS